MSEPTDDPNRGWVTHSSSDWQRYVDANEARIAAISRAEKAEAEREELLQALECLLNATMYKDHPAESQMAIDAIARARGTSR